jgi:outer membrane protein insertion porin family
MRPVPQRAILRPILLLAGFIFYSGLLAGISGSEETGEMIREIRIESRVPFASERFAELTRLRSDGPFSWDALHRDMKSLFDTGLFQDVVATVKSVAGGVALDFTLIEKRIIHTIAYSGDLRLPVEKVQQATGLKQGGEYVPGEWEQALNQLRLLYRREGYPSAEIRGESLFPEEGGAADLRVEIDAGEPLRIRNLLLEGKMGLAEGVLRSGMLLSPGSILSLEKLEGDLLRLRELYAKEGYLVASVGPPVVRQSGPARADLIVPVESGPVVEVAFEGKRRFSEKELRARLFFLEMKSLEESILAESARRLERFYRENNYLKAEVRFRKEADPERNRARVIFLLNPGTHFSLGEIRFVGNEHFGAERLKALLETRENGLFHRARFNEEIAKDDAARLVSFYRRNGFLHPNVSFQTFLEEERGQIVLLFQIKEGVQTLIERVEFAGGQALPTQALEQAIHSKVGAPFDEVAVQDDRLSLETAYGRAGYIFAKVDSSTRFTEGERKVALVFRIDQGEEVHVGAIHLSGNDFTQTNVIRRELRLQPGDLYDPEKILLSKQKLYHLGFFSDVQLEPVDPLSRGSVRDLDLRVRERPGGTISFGVGYGDFEGLRGSIDIGHKNLLGTGREIHGRIEGSRLLRRFSVDYREPWMFNRGDMNGRAGAVYQTRTEVAFTFDKLGTFVGVDKSFSDKLKGAFVYEVEWDRIYDLDAGVQLSVQDAGRLRLATLNPSLVWDTRNDPFEPTSGFINGFTLRSGVAGLGSQVSFNKLNLQSSWFVDLTGKIVLALSARGGVARRVGSGEPIPINERFFLGGQGTLRGYRQDQVGVVGETLIGGNPTGGDGMILFNEELRLPLPYSLGLVFFFDHGNVWRKVGLVRFDQIKSSVGTGLRYRTPVGPIRVDFGYKLNRESGEEPWRVHFTLGEVF